MDDLFDANFLQSIFAGKTVKLTDRESYCVRQVIQGLSKDQIAREMNVTTERIRQIVAKAARKAGYKPPPSPVVEISDSPYASEINLVFEKFSPKDALQEDLDRLKEEVIKCFSIHCDLYKND